MKIAITMTQKDLDNLFKWRDENKEFIYNNFNLPAEEGNIFIESYAVLEFKFINKTILETTNYAITPNNKRIKASYSKFRYYGESKWKQIDFHMREDLFDKEATAREESQWMLTTVISSLSYLLFLPNEMQVEEKQTIHRDPRFKRRGKWVNPPARKIIIKNYTFKRTPIAKRLTRKQLVFSLKCWGVRGHYRHYKDGRVVFVKPYQKGINRNKEQATISYKFDIE